jgi:hypothetical protein
MGPDNTQGASQMLGFDCRATQRGKQKWVAVAVLAKVAEEVDSGLGCCSKVEHALSIGQALDSIPSTKRKKRVLAPSGVSTL